LLLLSLPVSFDQNDIFNSIVSAIIIFGFSKSFSYMKVQLIKMQKFLRKLRAKSLKKMRKHRFDQRYFIYQANKANSLFFIFIMVAIFNLMLMLKIPNTVWYYQLLILLPTLVFEFKWLMQKSYVEDLIKYQPKIHQA
jgi:hypothetical protein